MEKPSIVIVQDAFQTPRVYAALAKGLTEAGYETVIPFLPSCSNINSEDYPARTIDDNSLAVTQEIETLVEGHGKLVVMVMHSYGGVAGSNAIPESLSYRKRREKAQKGGVIHLYYICGLILNEGESGQDTLTFVDEDDQANGVSYFRNAAKLLYSDLDYAEAALWESRIIPQPAAVLWTEWLALPTDTFHRRTYFAEAEIERCSAGHAENIDCSNQGYANGVGLTSLFYQDADGQSTDFS